MMTFDSIEAVAGKEKVLTDCLRISFGLVLIGLLMTAVAACAPLVHDEPKFEVWQTGAVVNYRGSLAEAGVAQVRQLLASDEDIHTLAIESYGGIIEFGMDLGDLVIGHALDVRVFGDGCLSSCANYVFVAGRSKHIEPGAIVAWHGSAIQETWGGWRAGSSKSRAMLEHSRARQAEFFSRLPVDERITIVGQDLGCRCIWTVSIEDMARFGINEVYSIELYDESVIEGAGFKRLEFLRLPEDVFDQIRAPRPEIVTRDNASKDDDGRGS